MIEITRPWAFWRRVQYAAGFLFLFMLGMVLAYVFFWKVEPTCFDGFQNGNERGVDCGGSCSRICEFDITSPQILWSQAFKITDGQYNAVAYVENRNKSIGTGALGYTMRLYDRNGLILERSGSTVLPPDGVYPIFEGRLMTGDRVPTKTEVSLESGTQWMPGTSGKEQFMLASRELKDVDSKPQLIATLRNESLDEEQDVEVVATIFDANKNPLTVARTVVEYFPGRNTKEVVFTWPLPIAKTLRSCEIPTDVILGIDLSGSMNNDGGNPPEPITSTLKAAEVFIRTLREGDQVSVVTYATVATTTERLTSEIDRVAGSVAKLTINPKEEVGNTNTGDAFTKIREEILSSRHNSDARKVAIILTDGLATAPEKDPEIFAETEAKALKATDTEVFTIGLGANLNEDALKRLASNPSQYYKAPSTKELTNIYRSITESICEDGPAVIEVIAKPKL